ncbi:MAG: serine/threonine protein phosphatase [Salinivirgaceae bacterium]|nr:MAG: serine/threonine protein phosphatase [Salinivirgaceae bacterium]
MARKASLHRLQFCNFKLDFLLNVTLAINENLPIEELLNRFVNILREDLNIGKLVLYNYNEKWEVLIYDGVPKKVVDDFSVENDLLYYKQITNLTTTLNNNLGQFDVIIPIYHKDRPLAYLIIGDIDEERVGVSPTIKHLHFIQTLANIMVVAIENKRLYNQNLHQKVLHKELELASKMQSMLIPTHASLPNNDQIETAAYYLPHFEVGGDYYDIVKLNDHSYGFCVADVSGKGISAALLMSNFQANLRALLTEKTSLKDVVIKLNERVMKNANGEKFITLFIGRYNAEDHRLEYINAGHNPPIFFEPSAYQISYLKVGCTGVGMFDELPTIQVGEVYTTPGSRLLLYTDGMVELENENQVEFGTGIMEHELVQKQSIEDIVDKTIEQLDQHKGAGKYDDDVTLFGFEFY